MNGLSVLLSLQIPVLLTWAFAVYGQASDKKSSQALLWFACSMASASTYLLVVRFASGTPWHPLVFLPLNLAFLPLYLFFRYCRQLFPTAISAKWTRILGIMVLLELASSLLPFGAWWYSGNFNSDMVHFAFNIKRGILLLFAPVAAWSCNTVYRQFKTMGRQVSLAEKFELFFPQWGWALLLIPLGLLPPLATSLGYRGYAFYEAQGGLSLLVVAYLLYRHLRLIDPCLQQQAGFKNPLLATQQHFDAFLAYVQQPEVLFQPGLRLQEVAAALELSPNYLSTIVNAHTAGGFVDHINQCRVDALLEKFKAGEHRHKTISALAEEVGFGSKSAFQAVFRKQTGLTPSAWIQNHLS